MSVATSLVHHESQEQFRREQGQEQEMSNEMAASAGGGAAHSNTSNSQDAAHSTDTAHGKSIRFFEYASVIPLLDLEQLHEDVDKAYGHHGRPHLSSRTYSVPIPTSFTQFFSSPPPREYTYDPSFIPNAPPRLNLKLPSFTRKRRNTISCQSHLKSCLKKRKTLVGANTVSPDQGFEKIAPSNTAGKGKTTTRARAHTLASSAPSAASAASPACIGNVNPVYCPALAKVVSEAHVSSPLVGGVNLSSSPSTTSTVLSTTPPQSDVSQQHLPPTPTELLPIRDCCRACRKAASYGERCADYHEHWTKAALAKRKRDEETLFERGEFVTRKKEHGEHVDEEEINEPARSIVKDAKVLEKEAKSHHGLHHSPLHSPVHSPTNEEGANKRSTSPPTCAPPLIAHAHAQIVAHQEARHEKQVAHAIEVDKARERIARLDVGKINRHDYEEEEEESDSESEQQQLMSPREGDGLQLEGVPSLPTSPASPSGTIGKKAKVDDEIEKNPICTLEGNMLRPCSSRALYTGAPSIKSPKPARQASASSIEMDRVSNSSSELSDDIISNLSSLGLSPASATTNASSWFGDDAPDLLHSPDPERTLDEGKGAYDYFPSVIGNPKNQDPSTKSPPQTKVNEGNGCSPLMRSKACLRPMGMYNPAEEVMSQSCPTIKEEEGSLPAGPTPTFATPTLSASKPKQPPSLLRSQTALTALEKEAELRAALVEADKPVFTVPSRTQSLPANAGRTGHEDETVEGRRARPSWTARFLHRGKGLASLGVAHGVVH